MGLIATLKGMFSSTSDEEVQQEPIQECESCGEQYYTESEVATCRSCGGVKIRRIA